MGKRIRLALLGALASIGIIGAGFLKTASAAVEGSCLIVYSDAGLDDFRAVAALAALGPLVPAQRIAIVITEGLSRTTEGAGAMQTFLKDAGLTVPIFQGIPPNEKRRFPAENPLPAKLPMWRENAERLNGLLDAPVKPDHSSVGDVIAGLRSYVETWRSISLLVIGPWTSFIRYAPDILEHVERIVVQGRPYPDELGGEPAGFNCVYDLDSCYAAFDLLLGRQQRSGRKFRVTWVDIPGSAEACGSAEPGVDESGKRNYAFVPTPGWADELDRAAEQADKQVDGRGRVAREVAKLLRKNPAGLEKTSLWDDLAAIYLMRPDVFVVRGGHVEPCVKAEAIRRLLTDAMIVQESARASD